MPLTIPTVTVHDNTRSGHKSIINERDYNPAIHRLWVEGEANTPIPRIEPEPVRTITQEPAPTVIWRRGRHKREPHGYGKLIE